MRQNLLWHCARPLLLLSCVVTSTSCEERLLQTTPAAPPPPIGLVGVWVHVLPEERRGETLTLGADSSANGRIDQDQQTTDSLRWEIRFGSRDPVTERADWYGGYTDGGDAACSLGRQVEGCISMPMLCVGRRAAMFCRAFRYQHPDSLRLSTGALLVKHSLPSL